MRLLADLRSHVTTPPAPEIIQVQRVPAVGDQTISNGKFVLGMPLDVDFPITSASYILNGAGEVDAGSVVSQGFAYLLAAYPQYGNIYFNPLLTSDNVAELVLDQSFHFTDKSLVPPKTFYPRFQTGRENGVADDGQMPTHTALLGANTGLTPTRPGLILTDEIDITDFTLDCNGDPVGADQFLVYWKLYTFTVTEDVATDWPTPTNTPALRTVRETDQEPVDFTVYITTDGGANWCEVGLLEPVAFCDKTTKVRLAFRNDGPTKVFLANFALLF